MRNYYNKIKNVAIAIVNIYSYSLLMLGFILAIEKLLSLLDSEHL